MSFIDNNEEPDLSKPLGSNILNISNNHHFEHDLCLGSPSFAIPFFIDVTFEFDLVVEIIISNISSYDEA